MEVIDGSPTFEDFLDIIQGFRQRKSKDLYMRVRKQIIARKDALFAPSEDKKRS
jgi:hypothetical protein